MELFAVGTPNTVIRLVLRSERVIFSNNQYNFFHDQDENELRSRFPVKEKDPGPGQRE